MIANTPLPKDIEQEFSDRKCKLLKFEKKSVKLQYMCECGEIKEKMYSDFKKNRECRTCTSKKLKEKPNYEFTTDDGQIWKPIVGGWISNIGNAKNTLKKDLTLCKEKFRYNIGGKAQYATRLLAEAFEIENYEKLNDSKYIVMLKDRNPLNISLENLKITTKSETNSLNGQKSRQSEKFKEKVLWTRARFSDIENKVVSELPDHILYRNGEIWNGDRFLTFSEYGDYQYLCGKEKNYKVHRIICYAFNPLEGKMKFSDYDDLEVNHKDGNKLNNHADNLEWESRENNMKHSYNTGLNKKVRNILQYSLSGDFIKEYISIAEASRQTKEPEHRIRSVAQGKKSNITKFIWKFKNEEETKEYSKKYSKNS